MHDNKRKRGDEEDTPQGQAADKQEEGDQGQETGQPAPAKPKKLFAIFLPKEVKRRRVLHAIRHAESEANAASAAPGPYRYRDPLCFNPSLTEKGRTQALQLRAKLQSLALPPDTLWVVSPLSRTLETLLLALGNRPVAGQPGRIEEPLSRPLPPRLRVRSDAAEQVRTTGDVPIPISAAAAQFPQVREHLTGIPERYWYRPDKNCAELRRLEAREPKEELEARCRRFREWLHAQDAPCIVVVSHFCFLQAFLLPFLGSRQKLGNAQVVTVKV